MADNYKLSVTIEALDKFTPIMKKVSGLMGTSQKDIDKTTKSFKGLGNSSQDVDKLNKSLKEMQNYENGIKRLNDGFTTFKSTLLDLGLVAASSKALKELFGLAKEAGNIQMKNIELGGIYGLNETSKQLQDINKQANELSNMTLFSTKDILAINTELGHAQVNIQNLAKVVPQATYLAEVEVGIGKSGSPTQSAYNFARMAEDSGITSDTDRMAKFADEMYRVLNVTHASTESLGETFKYAMPTARMLGWNENDMLQAGGFAAVNGMEGSMAGTHIKNFLERSNPLKPEMANNQKILAALDAAGFINGVSTSKNKSGKIEITGFKSSALMQDKDHMKNFQDMVTVLEQKHDEFLSKNGNKNSVTSTLTKEELDALKSHTKELTGTEMTGGELEWAALMNRIYGEQGQDFAIISTHKKNVEKLNQSLEQQASLEDQAKKIRESFTGQLHVLESNFQNFGIAIGNQIMPEITKYMKEISPMIAKAKDWVAAHGELAKKIVEITAGIATGILVFASASLAIKTFGALFGPLKTIVTDFFALFKTSKLSSQSSMMEMSANVVNLYGTEINGAGGVPIGGGGAGGKGVQVAEEVVEGLPTRAARQAAEKGVSYGVLKTVGTTAAKSFSAGMKSLKFSLPVSLAFGAYDVVTAPEGKKVETTVKTSGGIIGGWAGAEAGAALGASIGSIIPGAGTVIGGILGAAIGGGIGAYFGNKGSGYMYDLVTGSGKSSYSDYKSNNPGGFPLINFQNIGKPANYDTSYGVNLPTAPSFGTDFNPDFNFAKHANGGIFNSAHVGMVGEAGSEAVIPLSNRSRGASLWQQAGLALGMGGSGGGDTIIINPHPHQKAEEIAEAVMKKLGRSSQRSMMNMGTSVNIGAF